MMDKLVITRWRDKVLTAVFSGRKPLALTLEPEQGGSLLNNIYIGKVQKVVKNISAAFVEIGGGRVGYLPLEGTCPQVLNRPGGQSPGARGRADHSSGKGRGQNQGAGGDLPPVLCGPLLRTHRRETGGEFLVQADGPVL